MREQVEENDGNLAQDLITSLKRVELALHRKLWRSMKFGEKPGSFMFLLKLRRALKEHSEEAMRVSELATSFGMTSSGITQMVTALEARGLVGRRMDPGDRRAVLVFLTDKGNRDVDSMMKSVDKLFSGLVDYLGPEKSRAFLGILSDTGDYFDRVCAGDEAHQGAIR